MDRGNILSDIFCNVCLSYKSNIIMENPNSVAFIATIDQIQAIPGADNIELAIIKGWNCIVKKGQNKIGELVVCTTTDAVIPEDLVEKLGIRNYLRKGNRVRTVKLKGVYSECLIISIEMTDLKNVRDGQDVMDKMGIFKYEPPVKQIQLASGKSVKYSENPNFNIYYKFPNIKNVMGMFTEDDTVQITRKIHGTNARYGIVKKKKLSLWDKIKKIFWLADEWIDYEFVVGSHNVEKGSDSQGFYDTNVWYEIAEKYDIKSNLWKVVKEAHTPISVGNGYIIYGEIYGAGIQKNYNYGLDSIEFCLFDIMRDGVYYNTDSTSVICHHLSIPHAPILYNGKWSQEIQDKFTFKNFIDGTKIPHEGIVIKYWTGERNKVAKVINPDYLIYSEKNNVGDSH